MLASYPSVTLDFFNVKASLIKKGAYVYDLGGIKRQVCEAGFAAAEKYGFCFVGGHPMAGIQYSGFEASRESLFNNATMLLVPHRDIDVRQLDLQSSCSKPAVLHRSKSPTQRITTASSPTRRSSHTCCRTHT